MHENVSFTILKQSLKIEFMKYIKLLMLLAVATLPFFTSCSEDEDVNSEECTVGFASSEVSVNEASAGYIQIPITVTGKRNGQIHVTVEAAPVGDKGAVEGKNYLITDKTLNLNADTLSTGTINVELKIIDDNEINDDRQFTLKLTSVEGATVSNAQTTVTITDNDGDFYQSFAGTWTLNATSLANGKQVSFQVEITAADEGSADYESVLTATGNYLGAADLTWKLGYSFDQATKKGTISFMCGDDVIGKYQNYDLGWYIYTGEEYLYSGEMPANWEPTEDNRTPTTLTFDPTLGLWLYAANAGSLDILGNITLTKN